MDQEHFKITKTTQVVTIGSAEKSVTNLWVCLHGYGHLAKWFARRFAKFENGMRLFVIPEGPHRFYLQGTEGRVGASWMTKEDRLSDIEDQFEYLESLVKHYKTDLEKNVQVHVLGFSQGVSTAFRWLAKSKLEIASFTAWAGSFPPDLDYSAYIERFGNMHLEACFGDQDEYISEEKASELLNLLAEQQIAVKANYYKGGHRVYEHLFEQIMLRCEAS